MAEDKNTYSTYAVKLDGEVKEELQGLLEGFKQETGTNAGDFIKTLLEVYKTNKIVGKVSSADADIKELNTLTNRIYSIYSNLIERNKSSNDALQQQFGEQLSEKDGIINNLKAKIEALHQEQEVLTQAYNNICEDKKELEQSNSQLQELNNSYKLNISKLQEELTGLQELKDVNKKLSSEINRIEQESEQKQKDNDKLSYEIKMRDEAIKGYDKIITDNNNEYAKEMDRLKKDHAGEVQSIKDKSELEKDKAILELKQNHQAKLQEIQAKYNKSIEEYQGKYKSLLEEFKELEKAKTTHIPRKGTITQNK